MRDLKKYKFNELYTMSSGISSKPEQAGHGSPFVSFSTVFNNYFLPDILTELMDTSEQEQEKYSIRKGDILLTRTSETIDELGMSSVALKDYPKATFSGFVKRLRPTQTDITYDKYMGFYLRSKFFRKTMTNNAFITLRASLNEAIFSYINLYLPDYQAQKKIGDFLYLLNKKVELNRRINAELESMAKTLYDYWFVQFDFPTPDPHRPYRGTSPKFDRKTLDNNPNPTVGFGGGGRGYKSAGGKMVWNEKLGKKVPEGWEIKPLGEVLKTNLGGTPSTKVSEYWENATIPWLNSGDLTEFPIIKSSSFVTQEGIDNSATTLLPKGSVVISLVRYIRPSIITMDACANQSVVGIWETDELKNTYIYPYLVNEVPRYMALRTGAQQPHINKEVIDETMLYIPPKDILKEYYKVAEPIYKKIINLAFESQTLTELRDWLLPMLMNGQVKV